VKIKKSSSIQLATQVIGFIKGSKVGILWFALARIGAEVSAMRMQEQKERFQKGTPL
jgi:hypothetical protein